MDGIRKRASSEPLKARESDKLSGKNAGSDKPSQSAQGTMEELLALRECVELRLTVIDAFLELEASRLTHDVGKTGTSADSGPRREKSQRVLGKKRTQVVNADEGVAAKACKTEDKQNSPVNAVDVVTPESRVLRARPKKIPTEDPQTAIAGTSQTHVKRLLKPLKTDLPKPKEIRDARGKVTDLWKEYALSLYPVKAGRRWEIPKQDYDGLIPDEKLAEFANGKNAEEKVALVRSIYDWFRYQHRILQIKEVLALGEVSPEREKLEVAYRNEMHKRNWPLYGNTLKTSEIGTANKLLIQDFLDGSIDMN